jgi:branched-chain amino acid transport system permease protein
VSAAAASTAASHSRPLEAWRGVLGVGLIGGGVVIYLCLVGIVPVFGTRPLIRDVVSLGQLSLLLTFAAVGYMAVARAPGGPASRLLAGAVVGLISGLFLSGLILLDSALTLRSFLPNASPDLFEVLTMGSDPVVGGFWIPAAVGIVVGLLGAALALSPRYARNLIILDLAVLILMGLFAGLVRQRMMSGDFGDYSDLARSAFASEGLTIGGAIVTLIVTTLAYLAWTGLHGRARIRAMTPAQRRSASIPLVIIGIVLVVILPWLGGTFVAMAVALIALYILMGLGLNITLGFAGLLDLGFVAFFAIGAYTVALLTSTGPFGVADLSWWLAVPVAVLVAMGFGVFLGLPILGIRGDYLAIATLGFGEIIALLARSDLLKPWLGGPQGVTTIPSPIQTQPTDFLNGPVQIFYVALACSVVIAFVSYRLRSSRLGRAWVAIREDEDVAEALGVNLVQSKTLAYMLGAGFAGLGGAILAGLLGSIFPSSFNIVVSINVAAVVIVGGMGSIPGVVLGAIVLIGLPELFREFSEYRYLFYGLVLMLMMRFRPEGLWPTRVGRREMHGAEAPSTALPADAVKVA